MPDEEPQERSPQEVYEKVLRTLEKQTGGPDQDVPAAASESHLRTVCCSHGDVEPQAFKNALRKAIDNDDVVCFQRHDGYWFVERDVDALVDLVETWRSARHTRSTDDLVVGLIETVVDADDFDEDDTQTVLAAANETRAVLRDDTATSDAPSRK